MAKGSHGTTQYRLNQAKDYAQIILEHTHKIDTTRMLSDEGLLDSKVADDWIRDLTAELQSTVDSFSSSISYREDLNN